MIYADSHRDISLLTSFDHGNKAVFDGLKFGRVLGFAVSQLFSKAIDVRFVPATEVRFVRSGEGTSGTMFPEHEQAWIHPNFVDPFGSLYGDICALVVDVCSERNGPIAFDHSSPNFFDALGLAEGRRGDPHNFAANAVEGDDLLDTGLDVAGFFGNHALHDDRISASHGHIAHSYGTGFSSGIVDFERHHKNSTQCAARIVARLRHLGMRRMFIYASAVLLLASFGCGSGSESSVSSGGVTESKPPQAALSVGRYKGRIELPKKTPGEKPDAMEDMGRAMGEAMGGMMAGMMSLEILPGDKFKLSMMGIPIEGPVTVDGDKITLTPKTIAGLTPEEAKKQNPDSKIDASPMKGQIKGTAIHITQGKPEEGELVFELQAAKKSGPETVANAEKPLVGSWKGEMVVTPKDQQEKKMLEGMKDSVSLDLRADNTYTLNIMFELQGKWKASGGKIDLGIPKMAGMPEGGKESGEPMSGTISSDGSTITMAGKTASDGKVIFRRL